MPLFDIRLSAQISIGGQVEAPDAAAAQELMQMELRNSGDLIDLTVERCIWLHDEDPEGRVTPV